MVWGGSLNKKGSDYIRRLREADKVISFLERLKEDLNHEEQEIFKKTIDIIIDYVSNMSKITD